MHTIERDLTAVLTELIDPRRAVEYQRQMRALGARLTDGLSGGQAHAHDLIEDFALEPGRTGAQKSEGLQQASTLIWIGNHAESSRGRASAPA